MQIKFFNIIFLFFLIYKGTTKDGPNDSIEQLKYCSSSLTKVGYGTLCPPHNDSYPEEWGEQVLKEEQEEEISFKDYCMLSSCTDDGLDSIAVYEKFSDEWDKKKESFDGDVSMAYKHVVL